MSGGERTAAARFGRALVRFNAHVLGVSLAILASGGLFTATLVLALVGGEQGGRMLGQLAYFFPGYSVSVSGAFIGALWAAFTGYGVGALFALLYGPWLLGEAKRTAAPGSAPDAPGDDVALLRPLPIALTTGGILAVTLVAGTAWLSLRFGHPSPHLQLLANYLPGYSTDIPGALLGAPSIFLYGAAASGLTAWLYNRAVGFRLMRRAGASG